MILVRLMGGLGNQMFQYAFGLMHHLQSGSVLKVDQTLLSNNGPSYQVSRQFALDCFEEKIDFCTLSESEYFNGPVNTNYFLNSIYRLRKVFNPSLLLIQKNNDFDDRYLSPLKNTCLVGRWQSEKYFNGYNDQIKQAFRFRNKIEKECFKSVAEISACGYSSVSVHIRRTDYISNPFYSKKLGFIGGQYYLDALTIISSKVSDPFYFVFSDDPEWAETFFQSQTSRYRVINEGDTCNSEARDLFLMTQCTHHIIANSTFSWWGAWLGNANGFTIAPNRWAIDESFCPPFIIPDNWLIVENNFIF
jgi:hypothetical protein